jgi:hypothetical protein
LSFILLVVILPLFFSGGVRCLLTIKIKKEGGPEGLRSSGLRFYSPSFCEGFEDRILFNNNNNNHYLPQVEGPKPSGLFRDWLVSQGKTKATIKETVNYAAKYARVLDTGNASVLMTLSPRNKHHAMSALANLAKYTGRYDLWLQIRQRYNLKWSSGNNNYDESLQSFERLFNDDLGFDSMLQRIREMIRLLPLYGPNIAICMFDWAQASRSDRICQAAE